MPCVYFYFNLRAGNCTDVVFCSQDRRRRLGVKKGSSFFGGVATAFHGGDGFKTDVKARALAREKAMGTSHLHSRTRTRNQNDTCVLCNSYRLGEDHGELVGR